MNKKIFLLLLINLLWLAFWGIERSIAMRGGDYYASGSASVDEYLIKCNTLSEQGFRSDRENCLLAAVVLKKDFNICNEIKSGWSLWRCFNLKLENDIEVSTDDCENMEYFKDDCLKKLAENNNDIEYCLTIDTPMGIARCGANIALAQKDISVCNQLSGKIIAFDDRNNPVENCVSYYLQTGYSNSEKFADCNIVNNNKAKDKCYYLVARNNLREKYCGMISDSNLQRSCYKSMEFWKMQNQ